MGNDHKCNCFKRKIDDDTTLIFPTQNYTNSRNYNKSKNLNFQTETTIFKSPRHFSSETNNHLITPGLKIEEKPNINSIIKIQSTFRMYSFKKIFKTSLKKYLLQKENSYITEIKSSYKTSEYDKITILNPDYNKPLDLKEPDFKLKTKLLKSNFNGNPSIYIGNVDISNNRNGIGILYTPEGQKYEGYFINNELNGVGRLTDLNKKCTYEGRFINSKLNGYGKKYSENYYYEGDFLQSQKNGKGKEETNEYLYIGDFLNDVKEGKGKVEYKNTNDKYEGDFFNNSINGKGTYEWGNGHIFQGSFLYGKMHGEGKYTWPNGSFYYGDYVDGIKEGYGVFTWNNGKVFKGDFKNGKPSGIGLLTVNGKEKTIVIKNGQIQGSLKEVKESDED